MNMIWALDHELYICPNLIHHSLDDSHDTFMLQEREYQKTSFEFRSGQIEYIPSKFQVWQFESLGCKPQ